MATSSTSKMKLGILLFCGLALLSAPSYSANDDKKKPLNKSQAAQRAQQATAGRVLKVDQKKSKYKVKVLKKSGRVVSVDVDKKSGKVSKTHSRDKR